MIRTAPDGDLVDPLAVQMGYERGKLDGPWVIGNFVTTIDGAAVVDGGSTAINDEDDKAMFAAMRTAADFILVGAGTVRSEGYGPVRLDETRRQARIEAGMEPAPHLVIVTRSLGIEPDHRVFSDPDHRVTIITDEDAPQDRAADLVEVADIVRLTSTNPEDIVYYLRMARVVLCEGGPSLMGQFIAADLVDEMALTIAPMLVAGESPRMAQGPTPEEPLSMLLDRVLYGDRSLFLRYLNA